MSVSAAQAIAPFIADGRFDGVAFVSSVAGICPGATIVAQAAGQPDKVGIVGTVSGDKVQVNTLDGSKALDISNYRLADGAQFLQPAQTVASVPSLGDQTVAGNQTVSGNMTVSGNQTVTGTLGVTGLATLTGGAALAEAKNIAVGTTTGTKIGTATGQKLGFWNAAPVAQQVLATGAAHTADDIITFLQLIGLCKQS